MPVTKLAFYYMEFNIFSQINKELDEFFSEKVHIAGVEKSDSIRYLSQNTQGYDFSQWDTLNKIDLYYNSKFLSGENDSEGQRKVFMNISKFRSDVASKQIDLDVKDFVFIPEADASVWGAYFMSKRFKQWAKESFFGELINQVVDDFPKYGTVVMKKVGEELIRVPLKTIRCQQDAKDLKTASYVIEEHKDMTINEMRQMKGWDLTGLEVEFDKKYTVYERYGHITKAFYKEYYGETPTDEDYEESVDCMAIVTLDQDKEQKVPGGTVLFLEEITERPYEEAHWYRQDGRWLGMGEIELQFENQTYKNTIVNLRRRGLMWSSKKIFQSSDPELAKNLVREVKDGDILKIMPNGNVTQVNTSSQSLAEFQQAEQDIEKNADQTSFTYEVATGESLPSGTPYRLGVVLSNAVNSHFSKKREQLGLFFKRVVSNLVLPIFKKQNRKEHTISMFADEEGVEALKQTLVKLYTNETIKEQLLNGILPDLQAIEQKVTEDLNSRRQLFTTIPEKFYDTVEATTDLVITGEDVDIQKKVESLTNLYTTLAQRGDPRAEKILTRILAMTGENYDVLVGPKPAQQPMQPMSPMPQVATPSAQQTV